MFFTIRFMLLRNFVLACVNVQGCKDLSTDEFIKKKMFEEIWLVASVVVETSGVYSDNVKSLSL